MLFLDAAQLIHHVGILEEDDVWVSITNLALEFLIAVVTGVIID